MSLRFYEKSHRFNYNFLKNVSIFLLGTKQLKLFKMDAGGKRFSNWKLNDKHNLTVLVKGSHMWVKDFSLKG